MQTDQGFNLLELMDLKPGMQLKIRDLKTLYKMKDLGLIKYGWVDSMNRYSGKEIVLTKAIIDHLYKESKIPAAVMGTASYNFSLSMFEIVNEELKPPRVKEDAYHRTIAYKEEDDLYDPTDYGDPEEDEEPEEDSVHVKTTSTGKKIKTIITKEKIKEDGASMFDKIFNLEKLNAGEVVLTTTGKIAIKKEDGSYVCYNKESGAIENQLDLVIDDVDDMVTILPVTEIKADDLIKLNGVFYYIKDVKGTKITAVNLSTGTVQNLLKETTLLGSKFHNKVVNIMDAQNTSMDPNLLMLMMAKEDGNSSMKDILMLQMLQGKQGEGQTNAIDPMMLMMMTKKDGDSSSIKDVLMMQILAKTQEGNASGINPMMFMMMGKKDGFSMKDMLMLQMLQNQAKVTK